MGDATSTQARCAGDNIQLVLPMTVRAERVQDSRANYSSIHVSHSSATAVADVAFSGNQFGCHGHMIHRQMQSAHRKVGGLFAPSTIAQAQPHDGTRKVEHGLLLVATGGHAACV